MRRATSLAYTDADEDAEKLLSFADDGASSDKEEEWVQTHSGRSKYGMFLSVPALPPLISPVQRPPSEILGILKTYQMMSQKPSLVG